MLFKKKYVQSIDYLKKLDLVSILVFGLNTMFMKTYVYYYKNPAYFYSYVKYIQTLNL